MHHCGHAYHDSHMRHGNHAPLSSRMRHTRHGNRMCHIDAHPRPPTNKKPASPTHERACDGPS